MERENYFSNYLNLKLSLNINFLGRDYQLPKHF